MGLFVGVDIGTSSSKGVLVDESGDILRQAVRQHEVERPKPGWAQMDATIWWDEFVSITRELLADAPGVVDAVGVSGMGPCVLVTDEDNVPLRPAILYGVDTRAVAQIERLRAELGDQAVLERCGSLLSTQAVGPKLAWLADEEPAVFDRARRVYMAASWLAFQLTGEYTLDHQSASQAVPMYDVVAREWYQPWVDHIMPQLELPRLGWANDIAGTVTEEAAALTGLVAGTPVIMGTVDAWSEAVSIDAHRIGDLMLMYGTTMFLINTVEDQVTHPALWGTLGALPETRNLAAGMATSGAITGWLRELFGGVDFGELSQEAKVSGAGSRGLICLPYFSGERTPIADPNARGLLIGLTTSHTRGDVYRAALEATAFGVRHNVDAIREAGGRIDRIVAVGGGTTGGLWTQIVSDVTGLPQVIPSKTIGASFGAAIMAAMAVDPSVDAAAWNPPSSVVEPDPANAGIYDKLYGLYLELYPATKNVQHALAEIQRSL